MKGLSNTAGENSRTRKLDAETVRKIRREYDRGGRGKANAAKWGISPCHYSKIGTRQCWRDLPG